MPFFFGLVDLALAGVNFFALSVALLAAIATINGLRIEPLIDLPVLLAELRHHPERHLWIVAMVASTLLPTFLHLAAGCLSVTAIVPVAGWNWFIERLDRRTDMLGTAICSGCLSAMALLYVLLPLGLLSAVTVAIWTYGGPVRDWYLEELISVAQWAGLL